ncbi:hypothetical protein Bca4012_035407 [Brassica carinata]
MKRVLFAEIRSYDSRQTSLPLPLFGLVKIFSVLIKLGEDDETLNGRFHIVKIFSY